MFSELLDPESCPQGCTELQMPRESQSHYETHIQHVFKHGCFWLHNALPCISKAIFTVSVSQACFEPAGYDCKQLTREDEVSVEAVNWTRSSAAIAGTNQGQTDLTSGNAGCQMLPELLLEHCLGRQLQRQSQRGGWCPACSETPGHPRRGCRRGRPRLWGSPDPTSRLSPHQHSTCQEVADKLLSEFMFHSGRQDSHVLFEACPIFTCILFEICPMFSYETNSQQPALL